MTMSGKRPVSKLLAEHERRRELERAQVPLAKLLGRTGLSQRGPQTSRRRYSSLPQAVQFDSFARMCVLLYTEAYGLAPLCRVHRSVPF